ncbi:MAG: exosortase/archaeosortase family protein [Candidatus Omnitrophica bacterium]|nr:exosortase/archaeosortase family protein [Candidatus Omnitrophota bacterium]
MKEQFNLAIDRTVRLYLLVSAAVYIELYFLPAFIAPWIYDIIPKETFTNVIQPSNDIVFFFILLLCLVFRKKGALSLRERPSILYLLAHILSVAAFAAFLWYLLNAYPFQPLGEGNILTKFIRLFNERAVYFTIRFRMSYLLISIVCHYTLLSTFFRGRNLYWKYLFSVIPAFIFAELPDMLFFLRKFLVLNIAKTEFLLLKISGFRSFIHCVPGKDPYIGTDLFNVSVAHYCSGLNGIALFLMAFMAMLIFAWERANKVKAAVIAVFGTLFMYLVNLLRIYTIILIGHLSGSQPAVDCFHKYGGMGLYIIAIIMIQSVSYRWMVNDVPQGKGEVQ